MYEKAFDGLVMTYNEIADMPRMEKSKKVELLASLYCFFSNYMFAIVNNQFILLHETTTNNQMLNIM